MVTLHSKPRIKRIHSRGKRRLGFYLSFVEITQETQTSAILMVCRIVKIDLSFPTTPNVSEEAKNLISQVHPKLKHTHNDSLAGLAIEH